MAKQKISDQILARFEKPQVKVGEYVLFSFLGQKKYGYVKEFKTRNWGIQYTVESDDVRYPCGIQIKGEKTSYNTGCIYLDESRSIGSEECKRRAETGYVRANTELLIDTRRTTVQSTDVSSDVKSVSNEDNETTRTTGSRTARKNAAKPGNDGMPKNTRGKRTNTELDDAISKQRDFLNGFVKRD
jgi:hypothetical protein